MNLSSAIAIAALALAAIARKADAQELSGSAGVASAHGLPKASYSWELDYHQGIEGPIEGSLSWINEGHFLGHHRDGVAGEAWVDFGPVLGKVSLSLGAGSYYFFDTQPVAGGDSVDIHAFSAIVSASLKYYFSDSWFVRAFADRIIPSHDIRTTTFDAGLGYYFGSVAHGPPILRLPSIQDQYGGPMDPNRDEIALLLGSSRVNTLFRTGSTAAAIEYRRRLDAHIDASVEILREGDPKTVRRSGLAVQGWLVSTFPHRDDIELGLGLGPYFNIDTKHQIPGHRVDTPGVAGLLAPTVDWKAWSAIHLRIIWDRVITSYNRDADVWLFGVGYRWH